MKKTKPGYTQQAKAAKIEGVVILNCIVRKTGRVEECKAVKDLAHGLTELAIDAVQGNWRFKPGRLHDRPVDVEIHIEITFANP